MKIAFPTNNLKTISSHTSLSKYFAVIEIKDGEITDRVAIKNPIPELAKQTQTEEPNRGLGAGRIIPQLLKGVDVFIANQIGDGMKSNLNAAGIKVIETQIKDIKTIIDEFMEV
ncbi:NifB/NifX family molybdenum-iron cluster-binding protein [Hippea maritima]|uniref:Iron-molybdenum cofactor-binding protein n=1 Tax=Hippea maritima (strain ATCC 700847 / DSM 10411 / MH2) TaxID=760142 RepID=F2LUR9_HIPMA|nr:NifB/NifX family molybdenum-iron cluster-binding protein [Hippea maritima]AEA33524.1 iron-molybdenum cofactor-binding protein [Hippea maritima DSM 10411]